MYGSLDISTSGMVAERTRFASISANIANRNTLVDSQGRYNPYRRREVMFAPGDPSAATAEGRAMGVHVARISINQDSLVERHDPDHPFADERGYVKVPDINPIVEQLNAMEAVRSYEANVQAAEATKSMLTQALRLLA